MTLVLTGLGINTTTERTCMWMEQGCMAHGVSEYLVGIWHDSFVKRESS